MWLIMLAYLEESLSKRRSIILSPLSQLQKILLKHRQSQVSLLSIESLCGFICFAWFSYLFGILLFGYCFNDPGCISSEITFLLFKNWFWGFGMINGDPNILTFCCILWQRKYSNDLVVLRNPWSFITIGAKYRF